MWTLRYAPAAITGLYKIPHGVAAEVTAVIAALQRIPTPATATPDSTGLPHTYVIVVAGYTVTYELIETTQMVKILSVE